MIKTSIEEERSFIQPLRTWVMQARTIATQVGCADAIEPTLQLLKQMGRESIHIAVVGSANSGKSRLINQLLETNVLPVSAIVSEHEFSIQASRGTEGIEIADDQWMPLAALHQAEPFSEPILNLHLANSWLQQHQLHLFEKLPLDGTENEIRELNQSLLQAIEGVVLVMDALMPLKKVEALFLAECAKRRLPTVLVLSKVDQLTQEELEEVMIYLSKHIENLSLQVIPTSIKDDRGISPLKNALQALMVQTDLLTMRTQQVTYSLIKVLDIIRAAAQTGLEAQQQNEKDRMLELKQRQQHLEGQNLVWQQIEQRFDLRRQKVDDLLRAHLQKNQSIVLELLLHELEHTHDVKTWWEQDVPFRLEREFRNLAEQLSKTVNQQVVADVRSLQEEVAQPFKCSIQICSESRISIETAAVKQQDIKLSDSNTLKIMSRLGTATAVIVAGTVLTPFGLAGAGLAASAIAGLTAEQLIRWNTAQERKKIRSELSKVVDRARQAYALELSNQLKKSYNPIISELKQHQLRWQQAQLQTLMAIKRESVRSSQVNWESLVNQTHQLTKEINTPTI